MTDIFTRAERSRIMRSVKQHGNKSTEIKLIHIFRKNSITGWRRGYPLFGKPDFVFPKKRLTIFVDGCFWHGHDCRNTVPKDNAEYWQKKIARNRARDQRVTSELIKKKWQVVRIWECEIQSGTHSSQKSLLDECRIE